MQGKEYRPPVHLSVVAIEKGAFLSPLTMVANITYNELGNMSSNPGWGCLHFTQH